MKVAILLPAMALAILALAVGARYLGPHPDPRPVRPGAYPTAAVDVQSLIAVSLDKVATPTADSATADVTVRNTDTRPRTATVQANFYRVASDQVPADDPAQVLATSWYAVVSLGAGESQQVTITAKNFNHDPIKSGRAEVTQAR